MRVKNIELILFSKPIKKMNFKHFLVLISFLVLLQSKGWAQTDSTKKDTSSLNTSPPIRTSDNDPTLYHRTKEVVVTDKKGVRTPEEEEAYQKLKRKVIKLYPYALLAKKVYESSQQTLSSMESNSEKRKFMKAKEEELRNRFENEIKGLYTTDGPVLVKLIHRETGKTTFDILKDVKGGFKCFFYQFAAKRYGYSLKETYDPEKDIDIENMVQLLKSENQLPIFIE